MNTATQVDCQRELDDALERRIEQACVMMRTAEKRTARVYYAEEMRRLIEQRSPEQVARMEILRGLR